MIDDVTLRSPIRTFIYFPLLLLFTTAIDIDTVIDIGIVIDHVIDIFYWYHALFYIFWDHWMISLFYTFIHHIELYDASILIHIYYFVCDSNIRSWPLNYQHTWEMLTLRRAYHHPSVEFCEAWSTVHQVPIGGSNFAVSWWGWRGSASLFGGSEVKAQNFFGMGI